MAAWRMYKQLCVGDTPKDQPQLGRVDLVQLAVLRRHSFSIWRIFRVDIENVTSPEASVSSASSR